MLKQKSFRLALPKQPGEAQWLHKVKEREVNNPTKFIASEKLFSDLLKRQAVRVMADITEAPIDTIPAHLARLDGLMEIIRHVLLHQFCGTPESRVSGLQLSNPCTLKDYLECLLMTRQSHRAPSFVNSRDSDIAEIKGMIHTLAGLFSQSRALNAVLNDELMEETNHEC